MAENKSNKTLLQSLLDCFSSSKPSIKYVFEHESNGRIKYVLPLSNVVEWWRILFSDNIVALSIAPRSHSKQLSKDALGSFVRNVVDEKNKSIIERNIIPHLKGPQCQELIIGEVSHLGNTIDLGVRARNSSWDTDPYSLPSEKLKKSSEVGVHYEDAVRFLMSQFCGAPYSILLSKYPWFAECINASAAAVEHYTPKQILSILACALILCLNITEDADINANILSYIKGAISSSVSRADSNIGTGKEAAWPSKVSSLGSQQVDSAGKADSSNDDSESISIQAAILMAGIKISSFEVKEGRSPVGAAIEPLIEQFIDAFTNDLYSDILGITARAWREYAIDKKAEAILIAYVHEMNSVRNLTQNDSNTRS